jgi:GT2 family glycosyltransferase
MSLKFGAFIMTYERAQILGDTIERIFNQSLPPEQILIVDNSESLDTKILIENLRHPKIAYHRVGYNAGPAGAAKIGLEKLTAQGFNWIYWGDDDDPPLFPDTFELLFSLINAQKIKPGLVSIVGQYFDSRKGIISRVDDRELRSGNQYIEVDSIAGNQSMLVNAEVVSAGILPDPDLFFGFEELDFCLKVKKAGYKLLVSTDLHLRAREKFGRLNLTAPFYKVKDDRSLTREYYSIRNLLVICRRHKHYSALAYQLLKTAGKSLYGYRYGLGYGFRNMRTVLVAFLHFMSGKSGKR